MQRVIAVLCGCCCVALLVTALTTPQPRVRHESSSAFTVALESAVGRLENGGRAALGATAVMMNATAPAVVAQGTPTFEGYTCQTATCNTYNPQQPTCDRGNPMCLPPGATHTAEPPPYNHTCEGQTCDGSFTCDFTADPRSETCDAANTVCVRPTFSAYQPTCDPFQPDCRRNNPGACTVQPNNPTCSGAACPVYTSDPRSVTCDPATPGCGGGPTTDPLQQTCDPTHPTCDPSGATCQPGTLTCDPNGATCSPTQPTCDPAGFTCNPTDPNCMPTCNPNDPACGPTSCPQQPTCDRSQPTCDPMSPTCQPGTVTCDPQGATCDASPTCAQSYTCRIPGTCETYDPLTPTCDRNSPDCGGPVGHTTEPPPYNHTCDGHTCDRAFTCDITADPRALTCDARNTQCYQPTFNAFQMTCNPMLPECRINNPQHCTSQTYLTCQPGNPDCPPLGVEGTTWGKMKEKFRRR